MNIDPYRMIGIRNSELTGIHAVASFVEIKWTLHNVNQG